MPVPARQVAAMVARAGPRVAGVLAGLLLLSADGPLPTVVGAATFVLSLPRHPRQWVDHVRSDGAQRSRSR